MSPVADRQSRPNRFAGMVTVDPDMIESPPSPPPSVAPARPAPSSDRYVWPVGSIAPNPYNRRKPKSNPEKFEELKASIEDVGQLEPCAAVTREAFSRIFPDDARNLGAEVQIVQVTGGRRLAVILEMGLPELACHVNDELASDRKRFLVATGRENLDRADLDPIEEAEQVDLLVKECGSGREAASQLGRTAPWVTYRTNLLRLERDVQDALRSGDLPQREVRQWHRLDAARQLAALAEWRRTSARRRRDDEQREQALGKGREPDRKATTTAVAPTERVVASALRRLGGSPSAIGQSLRGVLSADDRRELAHELLRGLHDGDAAES